MIAKKEYIGDGVYVEFTPWDLRLSAERENGEHYIHLDVKTFDNLLALIRNWKERNKPHATPDK